MSEAPFCPLEGKRIFVAGHRGMVGSAVVRQLESFDCTVVTAGRAELDLGDQARVHAFLADQKLDAVVLAAAKVGGILANDTYPADFLHDNLAIQSNVIHGAYQAGIKRLVFLGSSCIYPKMAPQPMTEDALLTGPLEPTNEWYAIAKIAGLKMCQAYKKQYGVDYVSAMPTNLYGPGDNYDLEKSHVVPALIRKAHDAKLAGRDTLEIWGSGRAMREFMHVDDAASAILYILRSYNEAIHLNVGTGVDHSIMELAELVCEVVGLDAKIINDPSKPDGTPRKLMDISRLLATGWKPAFTLRTGLENAYAWFTASENAESLRLKVG